MPFQKLHSAEDATATENKSWLLTLRFLFQDKSWLLILRFFFKQQQVFLAINKLQLKTSIVFYLCLRSVNVFIFLAVFTVVNLVWNSVGARGPEQLV